MVEVYKELEKILRKYGYVDKIIKEYVKLQKSGYEVGDISGWVVAYHLLRDVEELYKAISLENCPKKES